MEPPQEPSIEDCCHSGCNPCIYDIYDRQIKLYKHFIKNNESPLLKIENGILELKNTKFKIVSMTTLSDSLKILRLKIINSDFVKIWWNPGDHFLYKYSTPSVTCTRAYTPVKLMSQKNDDFDFSIAVKKYDNGLVSKHLFTLKVGDLTLWRGPYGSYKIKPNIFNRIVMVCQGTGIAPFLSIIENILCNEDDMTKIILYYCCHSLNEILFRDDLISYKSYWNFVYEIFLTCIPSNDKFKYQEPVTTRRFSCEVLNKLKPYSNDQFLICGSSDFMEDYGKFLKEENVIAENIIIF